MPTRRNELDDFLSMTTSRTTILSRRTQPQAEPQSPPQEENNQGQSLTTEEEEELRQFALSMMQNQAAATAQDYVESMEPEESEKETEEEPTPIPEPEPDPFEGVPEEERPVEVPDYSSVREETLRFSEAEWFKTVQEQTVILAGVGGIGSNMAIILAKLNPRSLYLFDDDFVETVNLAGQFYSTEDVGKYKVNALAESIVKYTNFSSVFACPRKYLEGEQIVGKIMVCGFDNMNSRRAYYNCWKNNLQTIQESKRKECLFMDGRLTATELQILCFTGEDDYYMQQYESRFLFQNYQAQATRCSFKQTGYLADMIGALMVNLLVNHCANIANPIRNMPLPFFTSYRADVMYLNTEV